MLSKDIVFMSLEEAKAPKDQNQEQNLRFSLQITLNFLQEVNEFLQIKS